MLTLGSHSAMCLSRSGTVLPTFFNGRATLRERLQVLQFYLRKLKQFAQGHKSIRGTIILTQFQLLFP